MGTVTVKPLAPELKTIVLTSAEPESDTSGMVEKANVAVSAAPLGTVAGDQFAAVFQSLETGFAFQVALRAKAVLDPERNSSSPAANKSAADLFDQADPS
jgi:hypothetical protein